MQGSTRIKDLFNRLMRIGIDNRNAMGETKLLRAVRAGSTREVARLLRRGANPDIADHRGISPLHVAAHWGDNDTLRLLLKAHANPNVGAENGWTPLHVAAIRGGLVSRQETISLLMTCGARANICDPSGRTAVDYMTLWAKNAQEAERLRERYMKNSSPGASEGKCPPAAATAFGLLRPRHP